MPRLVDRLRPYTTYVKRKWSRPRPTCLCAVVWPFRFVMPTTTSQHTEDIYTYISTHIVPRLGIYSVRSTLRLIDNPVSALMPGFTNYWSPNIKTPRWLVCRVSIELDGQSPMYSSSSPSSPYHDHRLILSPSLVDAPLPRDTPPCGRWPFSCCVTHIALTVRMYRTHGMLLCTPIIKAARIRTTHHHQEPHQPLHMCISAHLRSQFGSALWHQPGPAGSTCIVYFNVLRKYCNYK